MLTTTLAARTFRELSDSKRAIARMVRSVPATENREGSATESTLSLAAQAIIVRVFSAGGQSMSTSS